MKPVNNEERNLLISVTCDHFNRQGIYLVPDMFIDSADDAHKFLFGSSWHEYNLDLKDFAHRYIVNFYIEEEPTAYIISVTNNRGLEGTDEYQTFSIPESKVQLVMPYYKEEIVENELFKNWL